MPGEISALTASHSVPRNYFLEECRPENLVCLPQCFSMGILVRHSIIVPMTQIPSFAQRCHDAQHPHALFRVSTAPSLALVQPFIQSFIQPFSPTYWSIQLSGNITAIKKYK